MDNFFQIVKRESFHRSQGIFSFASFAFFLAQLVVFINRSQSRNPSPPTLHRTRIVTRNEVHKTRSAIKIKKIAKTLDFSRNVL